MGKSSEAIEKVKHAWGEPVTWPKLVTILMGLAVLLATHEAAQSERIGTKADRQDVDNTVGRVVTEVRLLRTEVNALLMKLIRVAEMRNEQDEQVLGQVQNQEQSINVTDWLQAATKREFIAREQARRVKDYGPCIANQESGYELRRPAAGQGHGEGRIRREGSASVRAARGEPDISGRDQRESGVAAGSD